MPTATTAGFDVENRSACAAPGVETAVPALTPTRLLMDGQFVTAAGGRTLGVEDPATGRVVIEVADAAPSDCTTALDAAVAAQASWAKSAPRERARILRGAAERLRFPGRFGRRAPRHPRHARGDRRPDRRARPLRHGNRGAARANDHPAGLVAGLFTSDLRRATRVEQAIEVGMVGLDRGRVSCVAAPFGGVGQSGFGHSGGPEGIEEHLVTRCLTMPEGDL